MLKVLPHREKKKTHVLESELGYGFPGMREFCLESGTIIWDIGGGEQIAETP